MIYPGKDRAEDTNYLALKHFGGHRLNGDPHVVFKSDAATELVKAAERFCWMTSPSVPRDWPHAAHVEREIRAVKELCRPIHLQARGCFRYYFVSAYVRQLVKTLFNIIANKNA